MLRRKRGTMHEDLRRQHEVKGSSERSFGIVFAVVFAVIGLFPLIAGEAARIWALGISAVFLILALAWNAPLRPLNQLWMRFGLLLHGVVNPIVMAFLFFSTVLPIGLLLRVMGKDLLNLKRDPSARSYWIDRKPPGPAPESMIHQF
jgi:hypothetical protein